MKPFTCERTDGGGGGLFGPKKVCLCTMYDMELGMVARTN